MKVAQDSNSIVSTNVLDLSELLFLTYQVLPQLFVVGDDAIVDDDKP